MKEILVFILSFSILVIQGASFHLARDRKKCVCRCASSNDAIKTENHLRHQQNIKTLALRGELEETLMTANQSPLLQRLGDLSETLRKDGVVRIDNVLSCYAANNLRNYVLDLESRSALAVEIGEVPFSERFSNVLLNTKRSDLKIPLGPSPVMNALKELLQSPVRQTIADRFGDGRANENCTLYELSCLISHPGSQRQNVHVDHPFVIAPHDDGRKDSLNDPLALTCFVALQTISPTMGPTLWIPGTHNDPILHDRFQRWRVEDVLDDYSESPKDQLLRRMPNLIGTSPQGSCAIFDSRIMHCGTSNTEALLDEEKEQKAPYHVKGDEGIFDFAADKKNRNSAVRAIFYLTFKHPKVKFPGNEGSIGYGLKDASLQLWELSQMCHHHATLDCQNHRYYQDP